MKERGFKVAGTGAMNGNEGVAMPRRTLKERLAYWLAENLPPITGIFYRVTLEGVDLPDREKPAVIAFKHQHMVDFFLAVYIINRMNVREKATMIVKRELFRSEFFSILLKKWGAEPITRPWDGGYVMDGGQNIADVRRLYRVLDNGGWYIFAPEGNRVRGAVAERVYVHPLQMAARKGVQMNYPIAPRGGVSK